MPVLAPNSSRALNPSVAPLPPPRLRFFLWLPAPRLAPYAIPAPSRACASAQIRSSPALHPPGQPPLGAERPPAAIVPLGGPVAPLTHFSSQNRDCCCCSPLDLHPALAPRPKTFARPRS